MSLTRSLAAEALGTLFLVTTVVGSGIMGETLAAGNTAVALLANAIATGVMLVVLIMMFGPISGAHFNPAVTVAMMFRGDCETKTGMLYIVVQIVFGILGTLLAHLMFDLELVQWGTHARTGLGQWVGEIVATFALIFTILACLAHRPRSRSLRCRPGYHRWLLVHVVDIFREPGRDNRTAIHRHFRVYSTARRSGFCVDPDCHGACDRFVRQLDTAADQ